MLEYEPTPQLYQPTAADRGWRWRRIAYYLCQAGIFLAIALEFGPNVIMFHQVLRPGDAYYSAMTTEFVPLIAAIKAYQRDFGSLPGDAYTLPPQYLPKNYDGPNGEILQFTSITLQIDRCVLEYEFTPANEGWIMHSPRYEGRISAPLVQAAPKPATAPTTASTSNSNGN